MKLLNICSLKQTQSYSSTALHVFNASRVAQRAFSKIPTFPRQSTFKRVDAPTVVDKQPRLILR